VLLDALRQDALPGVETTHGNSYARTVRLGARTGVVVVRPATPKRQQKSQANLTVDVSPSLLPELMPLLARLRHLFDLDAEPTVIDSHLEQGGLGAFVAAHPGLRLPGAFDGFEVALAMLLSHTPPSPAEPNAVARRVIEALGTPVDTGWDALTHVAPTAADVAQAGASALVRLGVDAVRAEAIVAVARMSVDRVVELEPGSDADAVHQSLRSILGLDAQLATRIVVRALQWPDAFLATDVALQRAAGASSTEMLLAQAEHWRPWRAYAAVHLALQAEGAREAVA
jgi:AraC family transcriptional regulator of adaptative response / DNA-3-methyladenine glycosylase II